MKRILMTGINGYIGNSFKKWIGNSADSYDVHSISVRNEEWKKMDFSRYDVVLHLAGIAHVSTDVSMEKMYYKINTDLTIDLARKSKKNGVKQFIFLSSIIVYGDSGKNKTVINKDTIPNPTNFYGNSKLQAELGIKSLESDEFKIVIIRPPMIYGENSKGNYPKLAKLSNILPVFPDIENERSMLHIDNLCQFIKLMIDNEESGLYFPQNKEYVRTSELVKLISEENGKKIRLTKVFNPFFKLFQNHWLVNKVFGNLVYEKSMSEYSKSEYRIRSLKESIRLTENAKG